VDPIRTVTCDGDAATIRAYLTSQPPGYSGPTVAQRLALDQSFHSGGHSVANRLYDLVSWAQEDGVFGLDDHEVHTYQVVGGSAAVSGYLLTVQPAFGPQLCFGTLTEAELLGHGPRGVDAAVHALTVLASHVTALLGEQRRHLVAMASRFPASHPDRPTPAPAGQPFTRPILASADAPPTSEPPTGIAPAPQRPRGR